MAFSGRGFEKRSAEEIASEIQENWGEALAYIKKIKETESDLYRLDNVVDSIFSVLEKRKKNNTISHVQELAVFYGQRMGIHCFVTQYNSKK